MSSHRPIILGLDGQPLFKSFAQVSAAKNPDGSVTIPRPKLPQIQKKVMEDFFTFMKEGATSPRDQEERLTSDNPLLFFLRDQIFEGINQASRMRQAAGKTPDIPRGQAMLMVWEAMLATYTVLDLQLSFDAYTLTQQEMNKNALQDQEAGEREVQGDKQGNRQ
jgi:hypothetical protein